MKTLLKIICLLVFFGFALQTKAQTEAETLGWLNTKRDEISIAHYDDGKIEISGENLHVYSGSKKELWTKIQWNEIKDIKIKNSHWIVIISSKMYDGENIRITLIMRNEGIVEKYAKALKHMATLKGAKLVNDDLF